MGHNKVSTGWQNLETEKCYFAKWTVPHNFDSEPERTEVWWRTSFNHNVGEANVDYTGKYISAMNDKVVQVDTQALRTKAHAKTALVVLYRQEARFLQLLGEL